MGSCTFEVNFILQSVIKILTAAITYPKYVIAVEPFQSIGYRMLEKGESMNVSPDVCGYLGGILSRIGHLPKILFFFFFLGWNLRIQLCKD